MTLLEELRACGTWYDLLRSQHSQLATLENWLTEEEADHRILPDRGLRLNALRQTPFEQVRVVITGQDPYPGLEGDVPHAMGLSFSVPFGVKPPRSLVNIYKELAEDCSITPPDHGDLSDWARQGVLMLNSCLTLRQGEAGSHAKKGWEGFTSAVLEAVNGKSQPVVFLAWGKHSHKLATAMDGPHHLIVKTSHPSPLGARKAGSDFDSFLGSHCFSRANRFLQSHGQAIINW